MTIYKYYSNPSSAKDELVRKSVSTEDLHPLYAITNDKNIAKQFEKDRNMKYFYKFKDKNVDNREWRKFANQHANQVLRYYNLFTKAGYDDDGHVMTKEVTILSTYDEREIVESFCDSEFTETILNDDSISVAPFVFRKKYLDALKQLQYPLFWKLSHFYSENLVPESEIGCDTTEWDDLVPEYTVDELSAFFTIYGDNLSEEFGKDSYIMDDEEDEDW